MSAKKNVVRWFVLFLALSAAAHAEDRGGYPPNVQAHAVRSGQR